MALYKLLPCTPSFLFNQISLLLFSYQGPWLQLPVELLESLLSLNLEPGMLKDPHSRSSNSNAAYEGRQSSPRLYTTSIPENSTLPPLTTLQSTDTSLPSPPPIDPGVFKSITSIRRFIDEASDLAVRAASGLSAVALGAVRSGGSNFGVSSNWTAAQSLGINPFNEQQGHGRAVAMSANRIHRLRVLAVSRIAAAYRADEIAASVMVMQGASALDDIADRVLKSGSVSITISPSFSE